MATFPPADGLKIETFGGLVLHYAGEPVRGLASRKAEALLVYLACTKRPQARDVLADLLWDDVSTNRARGNLSVLLTSLRQQLGSFVEITRQTVAFNLAAPHWVDASELEAQVADVRSRSSQTRGLSDPLPPLSASTTAQLDRAVALYQGDFLQGFALRDSPAFEDWMLAEQARLRQIVLAAGATLVRAYMGTHAYSAGLARATELVQLDPLHEELHQQIMRLLTYSGQRAAALAHYEACRHTLDEELGVLPSGETTALYEQILHDDLVVPSPAPLQLQPLAAAEQVPEPVRGLPFEPTPFVGRDDERAQLAQQLADPACRLLTLVGMGGSGKTRLAIQAATEQVGAFAHGAAFVALASLTNPDLVATAIAEVLDLAFTGQQDAETQLLAYLRPKQLLLVLDNFEHLLEARRIVQALLERAPGVTILVTSRERLHLRAERLLDLAGLTYPVEDQALTCTPETDACSRWSAVQLFVDRAAAIQPQAEHSPAALQAVVHICQLVHGSPLGIELAATWTRSMSYTQIAAEIARDLDFLATTLYDVPDRHRSLRAVFDRSWAALTTDEQAVLRKLAVFRGTFGAEAAGVIAQGSLHVLAALVDKSLVRRAHAGRYELHALLQQYVAERLAEHADAQAAAEQQLAHYYGAWLEQRLPRLLRHEQASALDEISDEIEHIRLAWQTASVQTAAPLPVLSRCHWGLLIFFERRGRFHEALRFFGDAADQLALQREFSVPNQAAITLCYAQLRARQAHFYYCLGQFTEAERLFGDVLPTFEAHAALWECGMAWHMLGSMARQQGAYAGAEQAMHTSLAYFEQVPDPLYAAMCHAVLGVIATEQEQYARAEQLLRQALPTFRAYGEPRSLTFTLNFLGRVLRLLSKDDEATALLRESLHINREVGDPWSVAHSLDHLGALLSAQKEHPEAQRLLGESIAIFRELGDPGALAEALNQLAYATLAAGDHDIEHIFREALQIALQSTIFPTALDSIVGLASLWNTQAPQPADATLIAELLHVVQTHPACEGPTRRRAEDVLAELMQKEQAPQASGNDRHRMLAPDVAALLHALKPAASM